MSRHTRYELRRKCAKCNITAAEDRNLSFHRFPQPGRHTIIKARVWAEYCYPTGEWSTEKSLRDLHLQHKMLCSKHFDDSSFTSSARIRLNNYAIPIGTQDLLGKFRQEQCASGSEQDTNISVEKPQITTSNNTQNESISNDEQLASDSASTTQQVPSNASSSTQAPSNASSTTQAPSNTSLSTQQAPSNSSPSIQQTPSNSASPTQQQHNTSFRNKKRRNNDDTATLTEAVGLRKHNVQYLSKEEDCYTSFGTHIAHELKKYDSRTFALVKHAINNIIFQADMGQLPGQ